MTTTLAREGFEAEASPIVLYSPDKRIRLATPTSADDEETARLRSGPDTYRFMPWMPKSVTAQQLAELREQHAKDPTRIHFNVFDGTSGQLLGGTRIFDIDTLNEQCEAGIVLAPWAVGKGIITPVLFTLLQYAFETKGMYRVYFQAMQDHSAMRGWLEKVAEARLEVTRVDCWSDGKGGWVTGVEYGILESEWRERVKRNLEQKMGLLEKS